MAVSIDGRAIWQLVHDQHGVITHEQLLGFGFTPHAIAHRVRRGQLHPWLRGIYAVGRPDLSRYGQMMVGVLACGQGAVVSHETAAELWRLRRREAGPLEVSIPGGHRRRRPAGVRVHARSTLDRATDEHERVPVTSVTLTLVDLASRLSARHLEAAVNMADSLDLLDAESLRSTLEAFAGVPGVAPLRRLLDRDTFRLTDSELERMFLRLVGQACLPPLDTQRNVGGYRIDFIWSDAGLVVETDSLRYHRTTVSQRRDAARDHTHLLAWRESVRFTHFQVAYEQAHVRSALLAAWHRAWVLRSVN